jgi:hypothetical protein
MFLVRKRQFPTATNEQFLYGLVYGAKCHVQQHAHRFFHLGVHVPFYLHFWGYIQIFRGATFEGTKKMPELHFLHARSCTMLFFVNITDFNSNSSSDWTIKK